ncbi:hypothetical protein ACFFU9_09375 [Mariniflexile ostreae]|uniref:Uncharacterized protein n=1 Tax=Mariniflexile ostreae TaxID=1520892 RepID=A0ABV5FBY0_9FLAO
MKYFKIFSILLFSALIGLYSCKEKTSTSKKEAQKEVQKSPVPTLTEASQNAEGIWHYTCIKGCAGGAGSANVSCVTCGGIMVHNQAYHGTVNNTQSNAPFAFPPAAPPNASAEPSQNAAGEWHYTCGKGCSGGSGTAGSCGTCGNALAHNVAYHQ